MPAAASRCGASPRKAAIAAAAEIASRLASVSRQPIRPQPQGRPLGLTCTWPISKQDMFLPRRTLPFIDAAAADARAGKHADQAAGVLAGAEAILAIDAGIDIVQHHRRAPNSFSRASRIWKFCQPRLAESMTTPFSRSILPGQPTPMPASALGVDLAFFQGVADRLDDPLEPGFGPFEPFGLAPPAAQRRETPR